MRKETKDETTWSHPCYVYAHNPLQFINEEPDIYRCLENERLHALPAETPFLTVYTSETHYALLFTHPERAYLIRAENLHMAQILLQRYAHCAPIIHLILPPARED